MPADTAHVRRVLLRLRRKARNRQLSCGDRGDWYRAVGEVLEWLDRELAKLPAPKKKRRGKG